MCLHQVNEAMNGANENGRGWMFGLLDLVSFEQSMEFILSTMESH